MIPSLNRTPAAGLSFRRRRVSKWKILIWTLVIVLLAVPITSGVVGWVLTHPAKKPLTTTPASVGLAYDDVTFTSRDGTKLRGWWLPGGDEQRVVVMAHGFRGNREGEPALPTAQALVAQGISVLLFDFRNSGESDGEMTTVGLFEKEDLLAAIDYVEGAGHGGQGIGLLGFSMGAATALMAAADAPEVQAVVADSPFSDLQTYLGENMPHWTHLPDFPFTSVILWELPYLIGHDPKEISPIAAVDR
ncbi:MAG TPA: alpha/beta fold hydrolase, partial [Bacilli bacterium]|nr:alpha/beta fold hydrolase [Bacilli bacterium]